MSKGEKLSKIELFDNCKLGLDSMLKDQLEEFEQSGDLCDIFWNNNILLRVAIERDHYKIVALLIDYYLKNIAHEGSESSETQGSEATLKLSEVLSDLTSEKELSPEMDSVLFKYLDQDEYEVKDSKASDGDFEHEVSESDKIRHIDLDEIFSSEALGGGYGGSGSSYHD